MSYVFLGLGVLFLGYLIWRAASKGSN